MHREGTERDEVKEGRCENGGRRKGVKRGLASLIIHMNCVVGGGGGCKLSGGGGRGGGIHRKCFLHKYFSAHNPGTVATRVKNMKGWA